MSKKNVSLRKLLRKREKLVARIEGIRLYISEFGADEFEFRSELNELRVRRSVLDDLIRGACLEEIAPSLGTPSGYLTIGADGQCQLSCGPINADSAPLYKLAVPQERKS